MTTIQSTYIPSSEKLFVEHLEKLFPRKFFHDYPYWNYKLEVGAGRRIADLVAVASHEEPKCLPKDNLSLRECVFLSILRKNTPSRVDILETRCGLPKHELRNGNLDRLESWGIISHGKGGSINLQHDWFIPNKILAFEAKLIKWSTALKQAIFYKRFADDSYVVLPELHSKPAITSKHLFRKHGVGLIIVTKNQLDFVIDAEQSFDHDWRRDFVFSRIMAVNA